MTVKEIIEKRRYYKKLKREKETLYTIAALLLALVGMITEV